MGRIIITLEDYLVKNKISKNKFSKGADVQYTQLQHYCKNTITRIDLHVLVRMCDFLNCKLEDIMHFEPTINDEENENKP